jgi:uncharacterized protein (TIGR02246 family)
MDTIIPNTTDQQAIRVVLQQAIDGWNTGDGQTYAAAFERDADYVTFGGMHTHGRQEIALSHQQLFDTVLRGSRLDVHMTNLRFLHPDIAIAQIVGGILDSVGQSEVSAERRSIQTAVFRKSDGVWRIAASQVTRIQSVQPGINVPFRTDDLREP